MLLYGALFVFFGFVYTLAYLTDAKAFTINARVELGKDLREKEAIAMRFGSTKRLAFATAVALLRRPSARWEFLAGQIHPELSPPLQEYLQAVSARDKQRIKAALRSLSPLARFQVADQMQQHYGAPSLSDSELDMSYQQLRPDLTAVVERYEISPFLKELGLAAEVDPAVREIYFTSKDEKSREPLRTIAGTALDILDAADELRKDDASKYQALHEKTRSWQTHGDFLYFSFVTVSTVGYGDITPDLWSARLAVMAEVAWGIYILYILLATLISKTPPMSPTRPAPGHAQPRRIRTR